MEYTVPQLLFSYFYPICCPQFREQMLESSLQSLNLELQLKSRNKTQTAILSYPKI